MQGWKVLYSLQTSTGQRAPTYQGIASYAESNISLFQGIASADSRSFLFDEAPQANPTRVNIPPIEATQLPTAATHPPVQQVIQDNLDFGFDYPPNFSNDDDELLLPMEPVDPKRYTPTPVTTSISSRGRLRTPSRHLI